MGDNSKIEWTDDTWNPVRGCSIVSKGCTNCYAMKQAHRTSMPGGAYAGLTKLSFGGPVWTGAVRMVPEIYDRPLHQTRPRRIFVNSMSDLFHEKVSFEHIGALFGVMAAAPQHIFQILTKRPERAKEFFEWIANDADGAASGCLLHAREILGLLRFARYEPEETPAWPLPNVWLGVSTEDQETANSRIPILLQLPARIRWISAEPLLGPIDLKRLRPEGLTWLDALRGRAHAGPSVWQGETKLNWVVVGGESGPGARACDLEHIRAIVRDCLECSVPVFVKQIGSRVRITIHGGPGDGVVAPFRPLDRKGGDPSEWAEDLRVREYPA